MICVCVARREGSRNLSIKCIASSFVVCFIVTSDAETKDGLKWKIWQCDLQYRSIKVQWSTGIHSPVIGGRSDLPEGVEELFPVSGTNTTRAPNS
jgi:hypothetical protein